MEITQDRSHSEKEALTELRSLLKGKKAGRANTILLDCPPTHYARLEFKTNQKYIMFSLYSSLKF